MIRRAVSSLRHGWRAARERQQQGRTASHRLLRAFADAHPEAFFVEIGAGDGVTVDHLRPFVVSQRWRGIMVEPVPYVFELLRRNYAGIEGIEFENAAIVDHDGRIAFYYFSEPGHSDRVPRQYHLLGSQSRELLLRHTDVPDLEDRIVRADVPCMTLPSLWRKHAVERVDVLVIDAEGWDGEIVGQLDFDAIRPRVLAYEDIHLSDRDRVACRETVEQVGYETMQEGFDTWCVDIRSRDALTETWRRIRADGPSVSRKELERWFAAARHES